MYKEIFLKLNGNIEYEHARMHTHASALLPASTLTFTLFTYMHLKT